MTEIVVYVPGTPRPQPRPRRGRSGNFVSTMDEGTKKYREAVMRACREARKAAGDITLNGPIRVDQTFWFATDKAERHGRPHDHVPDRDNLDKLMMDCAKKAKLIKDDCLVAQGEVAKWWSAEGGTMMTIGPCRPLENLPPPEG